MEKKEKNKVISKFEELPILPWMKNSLTSMGMKNPTPVQKNTIIPALNGQNVIGAASTGSGKTICFAIPIIQSLAADPYGVHSLVLTPTRELAYQIADQFRALGAKMLIRVQTIVGGVDMIQQTSKLQQIPHIIVATPGRILHILKDDVAPLFSLKRIKFLVLDEADRLLSEEFQVDFQEIMEHIPKKRQNLLFSATVTPNMKRLAEVSFGNFFFFDGNQVEKTLYEIPKELKQDMILLNPFMKETYLYYLLKQHSSTGSIIAFVATRKDCETIFLMLKELSLPVTHIHSLMKQEKRMHSIQLFKSGTHPILIATDVASRGLDIPAVSLVINFNIPQLPENYIHRVGRTARAGRKGQAISLVTPVDVKAVLAIEEITRVKLDVVELDEKLVLSELNVVLKAKQVAVMFLEDTGFYDKVDRYQESKKEQVERKRQIVRERNSSNRKKFKKDE